MKYLKTYENKTSRNYKSGDIVVSIETNNLFKIAYKNRHNNKYILYSLNFNGIAELYPKYFRKATPEEIEKLELKQNINKYNL